MKSRPGLVTTIVCGVLALAPGAFGGELVEEDLDTLRGITAVALEIEPTPDFVPPSISQATIRSEIEERLRAAGIALNDSTDPELSAANGWSYLYIGLLL